MKRILAFGLAFLLILGLLPASALADTASPAFVLAGGKAQQGDTVQVTLSTQNNTGIVSLKVMVEYDSDVLSLTAVEGKDFADVSFGPFTKNPIAVNWMNSLEPNNTTNGVVAVLTFTVLDTAADGETAITATYNPNDVFDYDYNNVAFDVVNGAVTVGCLHKETTTVPAKASTCLAQGNGEYTYCNRCEQVLEGSDELLPLGEHTFTAQVVADEYKVSDATCVDKAVYHHSCTLCGEEGETAFTVGDVDVSNHIGSTVTVPAQDSTCLTQGHKEYSYCDACKIVVDGSDELLPLGDHTFTAQVVADEYKVSDATCVDKAVYHHSCTLCGEEGETAFTVGDVDVSNHIGSTVTVPAQDSTCLTQGHKEYSYCDACKIVVDGSDELLPLGNHNFTEENATEDYKVSDATCVDKAVYHHSCTLCGEEGETTFTAGDVDKANHIGEEILVGEKEPTYEDEGYTGDLCCDKCGDVLEQGTTIDKLVKENGLVLDGDVYRYLVEGEPAFGWFEIDGEWYYFFEDTLAAKEGSYAVGDVTYTFEETGRLATGVWASTLYGVRYYYGPDYYRNTWAEIDNNWYYFDGGYRTVGYAYIPLKDSTQNGVCYFNEQGVFVESLNGLSDLDGTLRYYENGVKKAAGLVEVDGYYYFADVEGAIATGKAYVWKPNGIVAEDSYLFHADGKMVGVNVVDGETILGEIITEADGTLRYYEMGKPKPAGLVLVDGYYYFADVGGVIATGETYVWKANGIIAEDTYLFHEDGKLVGVKVVDGQDVLGEIATDTNGVMRYYQQGKVKAVGLVLVDGYYYFADVGGKIRTGEAYVWRPNGIVPEDSYLFHPDGKMVGVKVVDGETLLGEIASDENGIMRYYQMGKVKAAGLILVDGYYYFADVGGEIRTGEKYVWRPNGIVPEDSYLFHSDGKMVGVKVVDGKTILGEISSDANGVLRYYQMGKVKAAGLILMDGYYYFADVGGEIRTGKTYVWKPNGIVAEDSYLFAADGKMVGAKVVDGQTVLGEIVTREDGTMRYYQMGKEKAAGLVLVDGYYYFADVGGEIRTGKTYVWKPNGLVAEASYLFHDDGKMMGVKVVDGQTVLGEIATDENGDMRYYQWGQLTAAGFVVVDGDYYFADLDGKIAIGRTYVWKGNGIVAEGHYEFGADGKALNGFVTKDDGIYYYEMGAYGQEGLNYIDGYYYCIGSDGKLWVNGSYYVWKTNGYSVPMTYTFDELGRIVL